MRSATTECHLQIVLLDQTAIALGENASLVIDELLYDPNGALSGSALSAHRRLPARSTLVTGGVARRTIGRAPR